MRLLVIEDDPDLNRQLATALTDAGYVVDRAFDGEEGHYLGESEPYDAVILDIGLPKMDGISVLEAWRRTGRAMPVLMLTARDRWSDKVQGFDAGADDYVAKPFHLEEVLARVRALLRRPTELHGPILCKGNLELDESKGQARCAGKPVNLRLSERRLLALLMRRADSVVPKAAIEVALSEFGREMSANAVEALVSRTRKALAEAGAAIVIDTLRGVGYQLREDRGR